MAKTVADARVALNWMLDRFEARPGIDPGTLIVRPDYGAMPRGVDVDRFHALLHQAVAVGAISIDRVKRAPDLVERARLRDPRRLYAFLGRDPLGDRARAALEEVAGRFPDPPPELTALVTTIGEAWALGRPALGTLRPGDGAGLDIILRCVLAIHRKEHLGEDLRSFSQRITGDSKSIERQAPRLAEALRMTYPVPEDARGLEVLAALGLEKFSTPVLLRGYARVGGVGVIEAWPYIGVPEEWIGRLSLEEIPPYVMTVENLASFNRYVREVEDRGLVVYTGGFPSRAVSLALRRLDALLPATVPAFHWGDIDRHGFLIADCVAGLVSRPVIRHMMEWERAGEGGTLEQEALSPEPPRLP
jgi:hypothetical protein